MSKIKDLYAQETGDDDLKPVYNKEFFESVQRSDERRISNQIIEKVKKESLRDIEEWLYKDAVFEWGEDDEGHTEMYFENFTNLCEKYATEKLDEYIEQEAFDMSDEMYHNIIRYVSEILADMWADLECDLIQRRKDDDDEAWQRQVDYENAVYDRRLH